METVIRVGVIYIFLLVLLRVMGKRELGQLAPMELVLLILIPELVAQGIVGEDFSLTNAVIAVTTLTSLVFLTSTLAHRFRTVEEVVEGNPALLVEHGEAVIETMSRERIPAEEIGAEMRKAGIERLEDIKWAVLESDGHISFIPYDPEERQPPSDDLVV